jgi:taurine transport system substrate-binding protein
MKRLDTSLRAFMLGCVIAANVVGSASAKMRMAWQTGDINVQLSYANATKAFEKAGLDIELVPFASGPAILPALAAKEVDVAWLGDFPCVTGFSNGLPIKVFMIQNASLTANRLVANPKSGIKTLADMKGKKIGVTFGSTSHGHILRALSQAGLTQQDVTLVNLAPASMPAAYFADQVDAVLTWEPNIGEIEKSGGVRVATSQSLGLASAVVSVGRADYIRSNGADIAKLLKVWQEGSVAFASDRERFLGYEAKRLNMPMEQFDALVKRMGLIVPSYKDQLSPAYFGAPGQQTSGKFYNQLHSTAQQLVELKRINAMPQNLENLIDIEPLQQFLASQ